MCRLYGQISPAAQSAKDFLVDSDRSLLRQSHYKPGDYQEDGWGFGYIEDGRAKAAKSPHAAFEEPGRLGSLASAIRSRIVIGHIRAASNPGGLPHRRLIGIENTQPFTDGNILFAHNGTVNIPMEVAKLLGPYRRRVRGVNDSEVYFWQFKKFYDACGDVPEALRACIREMRALWRVCRARYRKKKSPYAGLNTLVSDGHSLYALCHYRSRPGQCSLFNPRQAWGTMSLARRGNRVILASEDMDAGAWSHLQDLEIVSAVPSGSRIATRRQKLRIASA